MSRVDGTLDPDEVVLIEGLNDLPDSAANEWLAKVWGEIINRVFGGWGGGWTVIFTGKVSEASWVTKGQIVFISWATWGFAQLSLSDNTNYSTTDTIAIANETKANNQNMEVTQLGILEWLNTSSFAEWDILYLGTSWNITNVHPTWLNAVVRIWFAIKINATTGSINFIVNNLTTVADVDGFVRNQVVNTSTSTSAIVNTTYVNDADHYVSINMQGSNSSFGASEASMYNLWHGRTKFINDGNVDFQWRTDVTDSHNNSATTKMTLSATWNLDVTGTVKGVDLTTAWAATDFLNAEGNYVAAGGGWGREIMVVNETQSSWVDGQSANINFTNRILNTVIYNTIPSAVLSNNRVILQSWTYKISATSPFFDTWRSSSRLFGTTGNLVLLTGTSITSDTSDPSTVISVIEGVITLPGVSQISIQWRASAKFRDIFSKVDFERKLNSYNNQSDFWDNIFSALGYRKTDKLNY